MKRNEFHEFVKEKCEELLEKLGKKGTEYALQENAFHNFEEGCKIATSTSPEAFAWDLRTKHLQSIKDIITETTPVFNQGVIDEKCGDDILYGFIIWALLTKT